MPTNAEQKVEASDLTVSVSLRRLEEVFEVLNRDLKLIFLSNIVGSFGDGLYAYILPIYMRDALGASSVDIGFLYTILTLCAALTPIPGGILADRHDRKKVMILAWVLWLPVPLLFSAATHWTMLFPAMIFYGCFISGPSTTAYIASSARKDKMNLTFTFISSAWWIGYIFSPTIGGYLATIIGMRTVFYMAFTLYLTATIILVFIKSQKGTTDKRFERKSNKTTLNRRSLIAWTAFFALIMFLNVLMRPFIPTFLEDVYWFDTFLIGILGSLTFAGSALLGVLIGRVGDKFGNEVAVAICLPLAAVSLTLLQLTANFLLLVPVFFIIGATFTPWPLMNATISSLSPENLRGRWVSISQTASMSAAFVAPYIGGSLYAVSPNFPFIITVAGSTILLGLILLVQKWK